MLRRYHDINYVLQLDLELGLPLIRYAREQQQDERLHRQWVAQLPVMALTGVEVSFADYKKTATGANIDRRPLAVIEQELDEVEAMFEGGDS